MKETEMLVESSFFYIFTNSCKQTGIITSWILILMIFLLFESLPFKRNYFITQKMLQEVVYFHPE